MEIEACWEQSNHSAMNRNNDRTGWISSSERRARVDAICNGCDGTCGSYKCSLFFSTTWNVELLNIVCSLLLVYTVRGIMWTRTEAKIRDIFRQAQQHPESHRHSVYIGSPQLTSENVELYYSIPGTSKIQIVRYDITQSSKNIPGTSGTKAQIHISRTMPC